MSIFLLHRLGLAILPYEVKRARQTVGLEAAHVPDVPPLAEFPLRYGVSILHASGVPHSHAPPQ